MRMMTSAIALWFIAPTGAAKAGAGSTIPALPAAVSNHAVALVIVDGTPQLFGFLGLGPGRRWRNKPVASMDHRGLVEIDGPFLTSGGMLAGQNVTGRVLSFRLRIP